MKATCGEACIYRHDEQPVYAGGLMGTERAEALLAFAGGSRAFRAYAWNPLRELTAADIRWDTCGQRYEDAYAASKAVPS